MPAFVAAAILAAVAVIADPYPPYWNGGSGTAVHFAPVAWPTGGVATTNWTPYTRLGVSISDKRDNDPSNGGTSPQSYVNVSSGCTDTTQPSVYYAYDTTNQVLFFRWRVQAPPHTYATGPNPGTYSTSSPWSSALWTVFMDTNGDGYRDFAVHLDGSSGSPSASVDRLVSIWSSSKNQSLDYVNDSSIHLLRHNPAAFIDGPSGTDRILNFHNALSPDAVWANGSSETTWDYGTTRASLLGTGCGEYFIDYQIPLAMLDATAVGGPKVTSSTPMSLFFATANSLQNPVQKDAVVAGDFIADPTRQIPGGDTFTPAGGIAPQPTVTSITASGCGPTALTANVFDTLNLDRTTSVSSVVFYYYADTNGNGSADDGSTWTVATSGTAATDPVGTWTASWNSSGVMSGRYLLAAKATDSSGNVTWSQFSTQAQVDTFTGSASANYSNSTGAMTTSIVNSCGTAGPSISKSVSPSFVAAGGTVTFTISIANTLGSALTVNSVTDAMPTGFTYASTTGAGSIGAASSSPSAGASGNITWTFAPASIPAGATRTLVFTATAGSTAGTFTNSVSTSTSYGTLTSGATDIGVGSPSLSISKTASVTSANPGDAVAYTITYANDSPVNVTNAVITDVLPTGLTFVSATGGGSYNSSTRTVTWTIGSIASGSGASSVVLNTTVDNPYGSSAAVPVVNTASITSTEASSSSSSASVYVNAARAALSIVNAGSTGQFAAGGTIVYTLTYANTGSGSASGVTITNPIPSGWSFSSATGGGTNSSGTVTWNIGTLAAGASGSVTVTLAAGSPYTGANTSTDTASISGTGLTTASDSFTAVLTQTGSVCSTYYFRPTTTSVGFDGTQKIANSTAVTAADTGSTTNNTSASSSSIVELARFYLDPAVGSQVDFSGTLTSSIWIDRSNGAGVNVTGTVYDYNSTTGAKTSLGTTTTAFNGSSKGQFSFSVPVSGSLIAGHRLLWIYTFASANSQSVQLYAEFGGTVTNPLSGGTVAALASSNFCVTAPAGPVLNASVDKLFAAPGDTLTYTLRFANAGGTNMSSAQIVDTLPSGVTFVSATLNGSAVSASSVSGQQYTFNVRSSDTSTSGQVTAAQSGSLVITATATQPFTGASDTLTDTASLTSTQTSSLSDSVTTTLQRPSVTISKSANRTLLVSGDTVTYTMTVLNAGPGAAANVTVSDTLPASAYFTYVAGSAKLNGATISPDPVASSVLTKNIGSLAAGSSATVSFQMTVAASGAPSGTTTISNTATVSDDGTTGTRSSNAATLTISTNPNLTLTKTSSPSSGPVSAGSTITYTLTVTNSGSGDATSVVVRDLIPSSTTYTTGTLTYAGASQTDASGDDNSTFSAAANNVQFSIGTLTAGASKTLTYAVKANSPLSNGTTTISSTATATASNAASKTATASITASAAPVLTLTKSAPANVPFPLTTLAASASATTTLTVASAAAISVGDVISVGGGTATVTAVSGTTVTVNSALTGANGAQVLPTFEYRLAYANTGTASVSSVVVTDVLPSGLTFVSADNSGSNSSGTVTWNLGTVASGSSGTLRVRVLPGSAATYSNSAALASAELSTVTSNTTSTSTGSLTVSKTTSTPTGSTSGNTTSATYVITLVNQSPSTAANGITVQDDLAAGFTYTGTTSISGASATSSPAVGDASPTWSGLSVPAGATATITFTAKVSNVSAGTYQNYLTVSSSNANVLGFDALSTTAEDVTISAALGTTGTAAITATIAPGASETLTVTDPDLNTSATSAQSVNVTVTNTRTSESETVTLTETGVNTGVFSGTLTTNAASSAGTNNSAPLNVASGDTVRLSYSDALTSTGGTATITADGAVAATNSAPVAVADSYSVNEDTTLTVAAAGVLANDTDADGNTLTAAVVSCVSHGSLTLNSNGSFTYTPSANYNGADSFTYRANDGTVNSNTVTVSITVNAVNDAPVAVADSYTINEDTTLTVAAAGVLANDTDVENNALTSVLVSNVSHGTLTLNANGSFTYTPSSNYNGSDSFTYKANDGSADSNTVTVSITVNAVNDAPVAVADSYSVNEDTTLTVAAAGVLANDTDVENNTLTAVLVSNVSHGTLTLNANGSFTYTPSSNYNGSDSFTYKANDGSADSNTVTVSITVTAVNDAPVAVADSYSVNEDTTLTVAAAGVLANDTDVENDALTAVLVSNVSHGTLTLNANGSFTYTPSSNYNGSDSFTYKANDGTADSNTVTVSITVNAVNDAPVAVADSYSVARNATLTIAASGVLTNDTDVEGSGLTAVKVTDPSHGSLTLNSDGSFTYTPTGGYSGSDSFTYKANDGTTDSNTVTVSITVTAANVAPVATADSYTIATGGTLTVPSTGGVLVNDTDADGNALTAVLVGNPSHGTLTLNANGSFTYTPTGGYSGADSFTYKANDGTADSNTVTVSITVTATNTAPAATADSYTVAAGGTLTVPVSGVLANDTDADGNTLTAVLVGGVSHGTLSLNANGSFTYTPTAAYSGADSFTYKANDGTADSNTVTVSITVTASNTAPVAADDSYAVASNATLTRAASGVLGNDTDADGNTLTAVLVAGVAHGALTLNANGSFVYIPTSGYTGSDSFTYKANDGAADSNTATVTLTIGSTNTAPVAAADSYSVNEDATLTIAAAGVLGNDTDADGNTLTAVLVSSVAHGTLTVNTNGAFTYTPAANYNGSDSFTYKANDGRADSNTVTVSITVNPVNDAPVAVADSYSVNEDTTLTIAAAGVLANDTDVDGNTLTAAVVSGVSHGSLTLNSNGSFTYTPAANYNGADSFTYRANDGTANSNTVTVSITVNAVNDPPVAVADSYSVNEDATLTVAAAGVLANDTDVENNALTAVLVSGVSHGSLTLNANGSFTYTPSSNYNGSDSFTYKANDGSADSNTVTVSITINAVNDAPVAVADSYSVNEDTTLTVAAAGVLANDTDVENNALTAVLVSGVSHGSLTLNANGSFTYTPAANYNGSDSFTYKANDGSADSNTVTVSITINAVNDPPVAVADSYSVNEDTTLTVAASGVLANDTDVENNALTAVLVGGVSHGSLTLNANGSFTYTPSSNYNGSDSFTYKANDGSADSNTVTVSITINAVNDPPVAVADSYSVNEDTTLTVAAAGVLANDTDVENNALTAVLVSGVSHGTLTLNANGSFTYTPSSNYNGSDSFTYKANDGTADSNVVTASITVTAVNDAPVAVADSYTINEDTTLTVAAAGVLGNDTDVENNALTAVLVSGVSHGTLTLNANGSFTYTPSSNYNGSDSFTYKANDGTADSNVVTASITVTAVNDAPVAVADSYTVNEDTTLTVAAAGVLANDTDVENNALTAVLVSSVSHGTLTLNANGSFTYTPSSNYNGSDSFTYKANDGTADSNVVTASITVTAVNDAPVAVADSYSVNKGATLTVAAAGVLGNDTDVENNALTAVLVSDVAHGTLTLNANGSFTYTPTATYSGSDSFTYKANDGTADSNVVTVSITVNVVNHAPVAVADSYSATEDTALTVAAAGVLGNDTDADSDALTAVLVSGVSHGTLTLNANGSFTYTPTSNYSGADSFTYKANDGTADSNTVTVSITVAAVNDPPVVAMSGSALAYSEGAGAVTADPSLTVSDVDSPNLVRATMTISGNYVTGQDVLAFTAQGAISGAFDAATGTLTLIGTASPAAYQAALRSVTYKNVGTRASTAVRTVAISANDGTADSNVASRQVTITAMSTPTLDATSAIAVDEDSGASSVSLSGIGAGTSGGTISVTAQPADPSLFSAFNVSYADPASDATVRFTPAPDAFGTTDVTVTITATAAGVSRTLTRTFPLEVRPVNDAPLLDALADRAAVAGKPLALALAGIGSGAANEAQTLTITATSSDPSVVPSPAVVYASPAASGTLTLRPARAGTASITVTVDDGEAVNHVVTRTFTVTAASGVNTPPTITPIASISAIEGNALPPVSFTIGDAETPAADLTVTVRSVNGTLIPAQGMALTGGGEARGLVLTNAPNKIGTGRIVVTVSDGDLSASSTFDAVIRPQWDYYLPDGSALATQATDIRATNPHGVDAPVRLTFLKPSGAPQHQFFDIPANTRWSARLSDVPAAGGGEVSTFIRSIDSLPLLVERSMTWDGDAHAGSAETALESTNLQWYFADGGQGALRTNLIVANPNDAEVTVTVTFMLESGARVQRSYLVGPLLRRTLTFADVSELRNTNFGMVVDGSLPIAAERTMYLDAPRERQAGSTAAGVPYPSRQWYFAEGSDWKIFQTYMLLLNPGAAAAHVRIDYYTMNGAHLTTTHQVGAHARATIDTLKAEPLLDGQHFWMSVTSDQPIAAERAMYWDRGAAGLSESHTSHGVTEPSRHWSTGDARVGGPRQYSTFVLIGNPTAAPATLTVTIKRDRGDDIVSTRRLGPFGRDTINVNTAVPALSNESFWMIIDSDEPILAERSQYWGPEGTRGGWSGGSNAFALPVVPPDYNGCTYNVGPGKFDLPAQGGRATVSVGASSRCTFTVEPQAAWLHAASDDSGSGVSQVVVHASPNAAPVERTGVVMIAGQPVTIVQAAAPPAGVGDPRMSLDAPLNGARVGSSFRVTGWAADLAAMDETSGVSTVHVWAYPLSVTGMPPIFLGETRPGVARGDVAATIGDRAVTSGFSLQVRGLPAGVYQIAVFAYSSVTGTFSAVRTATVTVQPDPRIVIDAPSAGRITLPALVTGWALDATADGTTGIDAVHVWAYPSSGAPPIFAGAATYGLSRPDVAAAFARPEFANSGYALTLTNLDAGSYRLVVFARRSGAASFDAVQVVDVDVVRPAAVTAADRR